MPNVTRPHQRLTAPLSPAAVTLTTTPPTTTLHRADENCIDVNIVNASGQQQQQQAPGPKGSPEKPSKTTKASKTTNKPPKTSSKPSRTSKKPKPTTRKRFRTTTSAANLVDPTPQSTPTPDGETPCIETPSSSPTPGGNDTGGDGNLAGSSNCYDNASKSGKSGLNFACASKSSRRFYACYPENPLRAPQIQKCPNGTTCKQHGKWIACRP
nr:hypothetical protein HK105_007932 [Polyrhizophydium stewartii]